VALADQINRIVDHAVLPEVMLPETGAEFARSIERRADRQPFKHRWMQASVEKQEAGCQAAGVGLNSTYVA
jgi:hypothetical protein